MRGPTKAQLEEQNERLRRENAALTLPLAYDLALEPHCVEVLAFDGSFVEVFYFLPRRADGGVVWLRERITDNGDRGSTFIITAFDKSGFDQFCDDRARSGVYAWRDVQQKINQMHVKAVTG